MTEEEFLNNVKSKIDILLEEVKEEEITRLENQIKEQESLGFSEEDVLKKLGSYEEVSKEILRRHGVNPQKIMKKKSFLYQKFEELFTTIHRTVDIMSKNSFKENSKIILDLLILILLICIIKVPFIFIRNIGDNLFQFLESSVVTAIWGIVIDFAYIIVAFMVFMNVFTNWFSTLKEKKIVPKEQKIKGNALEEITLNEEPKEMENETK